MSLHLNTQKLQPGLTQLWLPVSQTSIHTLDAKMPAINGADTGMFGRQTCGKMGTPNSDPAKPCQTSFNKVACIKDKMQASGEKSQSLVFPQLILL